VPVPERWARVARLLAGMTAAFTVVVFVLRDFGVLRHVAWALPFVFVAILALWWVVDCGVAGDQRRLGQRLVESEERYRVTSDHAATGLAHVGPDGRFLRVSRRLCDMLGYESEELLTRTLQDLTHADEVTRDVAQRERLHRGEIDSYTAEKRYVRKDGSTVWVELTEAAVRGPGGEVRSFMDVFTDVSERRAVQSRLSQSEADYRNLVEQATIGIFRLSASGKILSANPALVAMLGYDSVDDLRALNPATEVYADRDERARLLGQFERGDVASGEVAWRRKDGTSIVVRLRLRMMRGGAGEADRIDGLAEDVTQQRSLENQFRQAQRLEAVGRLAGGIAHDFNNVLTAITGFSDLLLEELPAGDRKRSDVEEIRTAAARAAALTRQLLAFSRKQVLQPRVLDVNALVETLHRILQRLIGEDVKLEIVLGPRLGAVRADPGQLEQVIMNLAVNARDAMPDGGRLTIETANVELDEDRAFQHPGAAPGRYVLVAVTDTGIGMDAETRSQAFEPFFTTKEQGKGTGLGLSTVYGIVKQSGGHIWMYSEPGQGATFKIYLPRVDEAIAPLDLAPALVPAVGGRETILLAEDDPPVREVASEFLAQKGYRVLRAPDGQTALEMARAHAGEIHMLVTDIVMPGMTGRELVTALVAERPNVRVLYMSGYTDDAVVRHGVLDEGLPYLQKPFSPDALARKVRDVLDVVRGDLPADAREH
jgi:two-component system, cell cycle sensor histidine kinase and response regulator CckA